MSKRETPFVRPQAAGLARRLTEPRRFIQVVAGPRQVGKTTLVQQVTESSDLTTIFASADEPTIRGPDWIAQQWETARLAGGGRASVLVLDEVQKIPGWSESVKRLWDEDTRHRRPVKVVVLGSAPLLIQRGLSESLAKGSAVASDAFFPFPDGLLAAAAAGATAVIQPGGSVNDKDVIAAANEAGLAMVFTGVRHFRH